jgi:ElaB/YqjD/DUF883 family membrane-anchored ribosome-binding protein
LAGAEAGLFRAFLPFQLLAFLPHPANTALQFDILVYVNPLGRNWEGRNQPMTEALRQGSENPEFGADRTLPRPERIYIAESSSALERTAEQAGSAVGRAAAAVRNIQEKFTQAGGEGPARARAQELSQAATARAQEWMQLVRERSLELKDRAQERWEQTRAQARRLVDERPIHVAVGAGAIGFLLGVALRIRRARHAER